MGKPLLILDVDETLVYATEQPLPGRSPEHRVGPFAIYCRPHLTEFLQSAAKWYDLAIWSSASPDHVAGVVALLFPDSTRLKFVWAADRCTLRYHPELQERYYAKNLKKVCRLGYALEQILMVDDSPEKLSQHYGNHIRVLPFTGDMNDDELARLLPFISRLSAAENFVPLKSETGDSSAARPFNGSRVFGVGVLVHRRRLVRLPTVGEYAHPTEIIAPFAVKKKLNREGREEREEQTSLDFICVHRSSSVARISSSVFLRFPPR